MAEEEKAKSAEGWLKRFIETFDWWFTLTRGQQLAVVSIGLFLLGVLAMVAVADPEVLARFGVKVKNATPLWVIGSTGIVFSVISFGFAFASPTPKLVTEDEVKRDFVKRPLGQTPTVAWSDPKQSVELQWVKLPHGSKGRKLWVVVGNAEHGGADFRLYPHPANVMGDGRLILTPFLIGDDTDRAKRFTLSVVAAEGKAAQELDDYYHSACEDCDWKGIPRHAWPGNGMDTLLEATIARL